MTNDRELREVARRWPELTSAMPAIMAEAREKVATWRYVDFLSEAGHLEPHQAERSGLDPDEVCDDPADVDSEFVARLGYDRAGRFVVRESVDGVGRAEVVVYDGDESEAYWVDLGLPWDPNDPGLALVLVGRQRWRDGVLVSQVGFGSPDEETGLIRHWRHEEFSYDADGELTSVVRMDFWAPGGGGPDRTEQRLYRTPSGALEWIEEDGMEGEIVVYGVRKDRPAPPPEPRGAASERYRHALTRHLVPWARRTWPSDERVVGVVVVTWGGGSLPPDGVLVSEAALQRLLAEDPADPLAAWMVGEHDLWGTDEIREMLSAEERADETAAVTELDDEPDRIWDLLRDVCRDLTGQDWSDLPGGADVIVCLADLSDSDAAEFFARDEFALARCRARGWIP